MPPRPRPPTRILHRIPGAVKLPRTLTTAGAPWRVLIDGLIVLDDIPSGDQPYDWSPVASDRGKTGDALATWLSLPWGAPENMILPGFHTAAENGMRRGAAGSEVFLSLCGLMSSGVRTVLISRWREGGQTSFDLVREFAQELPHASPAEAWQRSVQVAMNTQLEPEREPRRKKALAGSEPPKAEHAFFWAGFLLADSGTAPRQTTRRYAHPGLTGGKGGKPAQMANPPLVREPPQPLPEQPVAEPSDEPRPDKRVKKAPAPRPSPKKAPPRRKPAPPDNDEG